LNRAAVRAAPRATIARSPRHPRARGRQRERLLAHRDDAYVIELGQSRERDDTGPVGVELGRANVAPQLVVARFLDPDVADARTPVDHLTPREDASSKAQEANGEAHGQTV